MDRRQMMLRGFTLPDRVQGAALFADISGFTLLTEALARELGPQRGAEELTHHLNRVYDALITELHRYGGSVITFSGDAITCWLDGDDGQRATACALAMQQAMAQFGAVTIPSGSSVSLAMKAAVATGPARRFLVGDPQIQLIDVLAGATLDYLVAAEQQATRGEVVLDPTAIASLGDKAQIVAWRQDEAGRCFAVVEGLSIPVSLSPWPPLPENELGPAQIRPWLLPAVYERLQSGRGEFLAELRPGIALFMHFGGIDYDHDEAANTKLDNFIRQAQHILTRYEGSLLQVAIGDKGSYLYAAFGAPVAHEDDARRAVAAALALRSMSATLVDIVDVQIGLAAGRMRTGAYGGAARRTYGVLGDAVNLAARLMQAAVPGQILASQVVHQAAVDAFTWEDLPDIRVKGKSESVSVFSLIGVKEQTTTRLQEPKYTLPIVGREAELALIKEKLGQARQGQGQIIGLMAEAGMGKSRLVAEVIRLAYEQPFVAYGGECQSYGVNTSYLVWQNIWRTFFSLNMARPVAEQVTNLEKGLVQIDPALLPRLPLLEAVLNLPIPDNDLTRSFDAKLRKVSLESLLVDCLRARARETPLLLILEDCHWLDALSHDLLVAIARAIVDLPVLLVATYRRTDFYDSQFSFISQLPYGSEIHLSEFSSQEAERLIRLKLERFSSPDTTPPQALVQRITTLAEGNPFYIEELLNYLQDKGINPQDVRSLEQLELPSSLHSLILSRIDQLTESQKSVIKVASVIGRLFRAAMLWGVYPQLGEADRIKADLDVLSRLDLTPLDTPEPELAYLFKHVVTQEVAYENLPYAMRAMLHEQIGNYLEQSYKETLDQYIDLLAYHYERSQNADKKRQYLLKAAEAAQADYANTAAITYYRRLLPLLPDTERAPIMLKLGEVWQLVGKWTEAAEIFEAALALTRQLGDLNGRAWCQTAIAEHLRKRGLYDEAAIRLLRARADFEALGDAAGVGQVLHYAGTLAAQRGDYVASHMLYQESLVIRRQLGDEQNIASLLSNMGIVARYQGDYEAARALYEESLQIRQKLGDKWAIAISLNNLGFLALYQRDYAMARQRLEEATALQREVGDRWYLANSLNNLANVARDQGDWAMAHSLYRESLLINQELGDRGAIAYLLEDVASLAAAQGVTDRALRLVGAAESLREVIGAPLPPSDLDKLQQSLVKARESLTPEEQAAARSNGRAMSLQQAVDLALNGR
jgi:class 3 adenylate cyclase/tetratricopeptide (TPR) repeat protein